MCKPNYEQQGFFLRGHEKGWTQDRIQRAWDAFTAKRDAEAIRALPPTPATRENTMSNRIDPHTGQIIPNVDINAIRPGDEVTVRGIAGTVNGVPRLEVAFHGGGIISVAAVDVVTHTPRRIEIGDRVIVISSSAIQGTRGTVRDIMDGWAWVKFDGEGSPATVLLSKLECS